MSGQQRTGTPISLKRTPKVDDRASYAMRAIIDLGGQDDVRFSGTFLERVKSVEGGIVTTAVETKVRVELPGIVRESRALASERVERLDGTLITAAKVDSTVLFATPRIDRLRGFYPPSDPIEVGQSWWRTEKADDAEKSPPFSSYSKLIGDEKIGERSTWQISVEANEVDDEHPVHVRGRVWLDKADGSLVRGQWTIDGFSYGESARTSNARLELSRVEL